MLLIAAPASAQLQGDRHAIELAGDLVEAIGGKQRWAAARSLHIEELAYSSTRPEGRRTLFCRDLERPRLSVAEAGASVRPVFVVGAGQGWAVDEKGNPTPMTAEQKQRYVASWSRNIYVMYHRLAQEDRALSLKLIGDREFTVTKRERKSGVSSWPSEAIWSDGLRRRR